MATVTLAPEELALIRAALRYWRDEMAAADEATQRHYFDRTPIPIFTPAEIESLMERLRSRRR